jgi:hypothetical protein
VLLTVPLTLEVPDQLDLDGLERGVLEAGRQAMRIAMREAVRAYEAQQRACPTCGRPRAWEGTDQRVVLTCFGRVCLALRRAGCRVCGQRHRPAEPLLRSLGGTNTTGALREACALAGAAWPYATAARVLRRLCGAEVSIEQLEQVRTEHARRHQRTRRGSRQLAPPPAPAQLLVGLDGGWVPSRDQPGGMEGKVAVVATERVSIGPGRHCLRTRRYAATFGPAPHLGDQTYAAAARLGGEEARTQIVLGDGATWIKQEAAVHFPRAVTILDWPHLWRVVQRAIRAARPGSRRRAERQALYQVLREALWHGRLSVAREQLLALRPAGELLEALEDAIRYLDTQQDWLGDYDSWRAAGYPIGSGLVERAVAILINVRMKRRGMRWRRANATAVVALRVEQLNQDWDEAMADLPAAA